jgi:chorismate mutase-like protein
MTGESAATAESLDDLRQAIDRIDDQILDLIVERTAVVERVGAAKRAAGAADDGVYLRPGREMAILRRLIERSDGAFPKPTIARMWRELFAALTALQGPLVVSAYMPERGAGYLELARDQYGAYTPVTTSQVAGTVVRAVAEGEASVGIVPLPRLEDATAWWPMLVSGVASTPRVVARLPICGPGPGRGDGLEALAIARLEQEPTGDDRTLIAVETGADLSRAGLRAAAESAGMVVLEVMDSRDLGDGLRLHLLEAGECCLPDDPRVQRLRADAQVRRATVIGGYATPFSPDALA